MKNLSSDLKANSSISQINWLVISIVALASLYMIGISIINNQIIEKNMRDMADYNYVIEMKTALTRSDDALLDYINSGNRSELMRYNENIKLFYQNLKSLWKQTYISEEVSLLSSVDNTFYSYQLYSNYAAADFWGKDMTECYSNLREAQSISVYLQKYCDELLKMKISSGYEWHHNLQYVQNRNVLVESGVLIILIFMSAYGIYFLMKGFYMPLTDLYTASIKVSEGDYSVQVKGGYPDPAMDTMGKVYNEMIHSIARMIENLEEKKNVETALLNEKLKNTEYERLLEQANFRVLQSQTNPHFMINTLNSISRTITLDRGDSAVAMIDALTALLRYNLHNSFLPVTLKEELEIVSQYLLIQQYRFQDRIKTVFEVDESVLEQVLIPKFTLQPIVENAFIHGLEPKIGQGMIFIRISNTGETCEILIQDNGVGMPEEKIKLLMENKKIEGNKGSTSIGLLNTKLRVESFTNRTDSFALSNCPEGGVAVKIRLPVTSYKL